MPFLNVFLKTFGFLFGITFFIILLSFFLNINAKNNETFNLTKGNVDSKNIVAILNLNGPILNNFNTPFQNNIIEYINPKKINKYLEKLSDIKPSILIIKINSPGGTVSATSTLEKYLKDFKNKNDIKMYFYTDEVLASGGYWIATTSDQIIANYGAIIGSIGASGPSWYYYNKPKSISSGFFGSKIETENGIEFYDQNAGTSKDLYNPFRKPNIKELKHLQNIVNEIYEDFLIKVSENRKIEINILKEEIGALIYTSKQAEKKFLIDDVLYFDELINKIVKDNKFKDFKIIENSIESGLFGKYIAFFNEKNNQKLCNKLKTNFAVVMPVFLENC